MLARSSARLDSLTNASPMDGVASALNNILPRVDGDVCKEVGKLISHGEDLERDIAVYNPKVSDLLNDVRAGTEGLGNCSHSCREVRGCKRLSRSHKP